VAHLAIFEKCVEDGAYEPDAGAHIVWDQEQRAVDED